MTVRIFTSRQFLRFLIAGGIAACVNFSVGLGLSGLLPFYGDIVLGYLAGMLTAFILFEQKVFGEHIESRKKSFQLFIFINILGLLQTWIVFAMLKDYFFPLIHYRFYADEIARGIAIGVPTITSFFGHKFFTFKQ